MNIIKHKAWFLGFSTILIIVSIAALAVFGLKTGIDFRGGTMWQVKQVSGEVVMNEAALKDFLGTTLEDKNFTMFPVEDGSYLIRMSAISEAAHQQHLQDMRTRFGTIDEGQFQSIGATVGQELRNKALWAMLYVVLGISLYVTYAFRKVSYPVKSWKYGIITLITLLHDVIVPAGFFAFLGWKFGVEIDTNFIVALLVVMGFSVHDTIVVFDRIRENVLNHSGNTSFSDIVNKSVNQTIVRSINTSLTVLIVLVAMYFYGPATLQYFVLTLLIGIAMGTYSSIFVASPLLTLSRKLSKV
ncbi:protein-export membrane protein SecF [Candidatus Wolfebacteria bacterium RIFOXYD12_FULL_48_21]|uniref:Protein-export membrane protein SecF n=1 Tax=Candidatus Wolfebacteria bacterium RIFOXYD1_FULL_48_65 TaxID=1802561 RepID=A0A1F8E0H7_9BACT|nr:MAG: protein-export membrane protein SecF [Candidatus Wolfebacteria bacterium RIFOXYD1_FULL_48_65]OGM94435.1 MAG: protein-export membrane protein SecF [Candidatus Wolfebacteria bacterium RIFOXYD12_FULL_48_21]OGM97388.1 MAG: protein-export membrane protein SecF [Candidatus Wolfebacteria bacterium RIFOXYD2_FULL_48_11]